MNTIKNIHKITNLMPLDFAVMLDRAANLHLRNSNIEFKITNVNENNFTIRATQGKHLSENYADEKTLITRTKELFQPFLRDYTIHVHPVAYKQAPADVVDPKWVADRMLRSSVRIKDIQADTGIDKTNLSAWISGVRPMSQLVKAMFYYYFLNR